MIAPFLEQYKLNNLSFFPVPYGKKEASIQWRPYQNRKPTDEEIKHWSNGDKTNIGVICGKVSQNLVVLDCDSKERYLEVKTIIERKLGIDKLENFTTISQTGRGFHIWLKAKEHIKSQKFPKLDIRGEGSYIIAPPSLHPSGVEYKFVNETPIKTIEFLTDIGIDIKKPKTESDKGEQQTWVSEALQGVSEGMRDDTCARLAGYLLKTHPPDIVQNLLYSFAEKCQQPPEAENPFTARDVDKIVNSIKVHHPPGPRDPGTPGPQGTINIYDLNNNMLNLAMKTRQNKTKARQQQDNFGDDFNEIFGDEDEETDGLLSGAGEKRDKASDEVDKSRTKAGQSKTKWGQPISYAKEFDEFLLQAGGRVDKREVAEAIGLKVTCDYFRKLLARRKEEGKIRTCRGSHYLIEWINRDYMVTQLDKVQADPMLDIMLPLGLHEYVSLPPRSVVGLAGMTSSGKTSYLLEMAELNVMSQSLPVYYWYNEMSEAKFIYRCEDFPLLIDAWKAEKFFPVMQSKFEFSDVLQPDAINLIDYIDRDDDVFMIGGDIKRLYNVLNNGVLIFALQKKAHLDLGYGGNPSIKLSNLYIALDIKYQSGKSMHCLARIIKCKDWKKVEVNPNSLCCEYHTGGRHGKLYLDGDWKPKKEIKDGY